MSGVWKMSKRRLRELVGELTELNADLQAENTRIKMQNIDEAAENFQLRMSVDNLWEQLNRRNHPPRDAAGRFTKALHDGVMSPDEVRRRFIEAGEH